MYVNPIMIFKVPVLYTMGYFLGGLLLGFFGTTTELISLFIAISLFVWVVVPSLLSLKKAWPVYFSAKTVVALVVASAATLSGGFLAAHLATVALCNYLL